MMASCSSVGSMAKVNPWTTQPSGGPNLRGIVVPDEVVVDLGVVDHDEAPPARLQRRGEVLGAEPGEAITVLDQDRRHLRVRGKPKKLSTPAVQPGTDLGDHAVDRKAVRDSPAAHASHLAVEVVALVGRGHPCVDGGEAALTRPASRSPTKMSLPILRAGTGSVPVRNHR